MNLPVNNSDSFTETQKIDVLIIGGGVAGLTAGLYAARDGFSTVVLEGAPVSSTDGPGGALLLTSDISNYPGFESGEGVELVTIMRDQAEKFGATILGERAKSLVVSEQKNHSHVVTTEDGNVFETRTVIVATGAVARRLGVPNEETFYGRGVSSCATCDGWFFKNKAVAVVGGGDTAVEDALLLTRYAKKVFMFVRGSSFKTQSPEARELLKHSEVTIFWNSQVTEILADEMETKVVGVSYVTNNTNDVSSLPLDGVFVAIGSDPATGFLGGSGVLVDSDGYILVDNPSTAVLGVSTGVYAAGDVADKIYRQAVTSAGKAAQAALEARAYLNSSQPD